MEIYTDMKQSTYKQGTFVRNCHCVIVTYTYIVEFKVAILLCTYYDEGGMWRV